MGPISLKCQLKKKKHNLKAENYVLFGGHNWGLKPETQLLKIVLRDCFEGEARIYRGFCNKDQAVETLNDHC